MTVEQTSRPTLDFKAIVTTIADAMTDIDVIPTSIAITQYSDHSIHVRARDIDRVIARLGWDPIDVADVPVFGNLSRDGEYAGLRLHVFCGVTDYLQARDTHFCACCGKPAHRDEASL